MSATLCRHLCCFVRTRSENDVTGTIGNSDSSGLLHPTLPNADRLLFSDFSLATEPLLILGDGF